MKYMVFQTAKKRVDLTHLMKSFSISDKHAQFLRNMKFLLFHHFLPTIAMLVVLGWGTLLLGNYIHEVKSAQHHVISEK